MTPSVQIKQLEAYIVRMAEQAGIFERYIRRGCSPDHREVMLQMVGFLDVRIAWARRDIREIEDQGKAESMSRRRDQKYLPVVRRRPVRFYEIIEVNDARNESYGTAVRDRSATDGGRPHFA